MNVITATRRILRCYTGVGSRETPEDVCERMALLGETLARAGYFLRSGGALGADSAFEHGARRVIGPEKLRIYLPEKGFENNPSPLFGVDQEALELASRVHPRWDLVGEKGRTLHARNCYQVLGRKLNQPSEFLIAWTADGCESERERTRDTGGTATAIALACRYGIPVFNLARQGSPARLTDFLAARGIHLAVSIATGDQPSLF